MEWIKIPTDEILLPTRSDWQNYALIKYMALYCQLEREPTEIQLKRILNTKQLKYVQSESEVVSKLIRSCIEVVLKKRKRDKIHYEKKCNKINDLNNFQLAERQLSDATDKIRKDKIIKEEDKEEDKKELKPYGEFKRVLLDDETYNKLNTQQGDLLLQAIEKLDAWLDKDENKKHRNQNHRGYFKSNGWVWKDLKQPEPVVDMSKYETNKDPFEL